MSAHAQKFSAILAADAGDVPEIEKRIIPIGRVAGRLPAPAPLNHLQGHSLRMLDDDSVRDLAGIALMKATLILGAATKRSLFISYAHRDGFAFAEALAAQLHRMDFQVFRDENRDTDGNPVILPGSETQKVIEKNVLERGFVLLIDTPAAEKSNWVREEVKIAFGNALPIFPIVVPETNAAADDPPLGGRFRNVRGLGREVRATGDVLQNRASASLNDLVRRLLPDIASNVAQIQLHHQQTRRRLIFGAQRRLENKGYQWSDVLRKKLLFRARKAPATSKQLLTTRLLVGCSPYSRLIPSTVDDLCEVFRKPDDGEQPPQAYNYAFFVHNAVAYADDLAEVRKNREHVYILRPQDLDDYELP